MGEGEVGSEEVSPAPRCNHPALPFRARSRRSVELAGQNRSTPAWRGFRFWFLVSRCALAVRTLR
jgi:hypothetical protein